MVDQMLLVSDGDGDSDIYKACGTNDGAACDGYIAPTGQAQGRQSWREVE
jgi:hypothetical protein